MDIDFLQAMRGMGGAPQVSAGYAAEMALSDPMGFSSALVTSPGNNFFGPIGFLASSYFGLTANSINGRQEPILRSNIFERPTPWVTSHDRAQFARNARMLASIQGAGNYRFAESLQGLVGEDSLLGKYAYKRDRDGRFVNPQAGRTALGFMQGALGNEMIASQLVGAFNSFLGDDRGEGASVYAAHARRIANENSAKYQNPMQRGADGRWTYNSRIASDKDREAREMQYATLLHEAQDSAIYKNGIVADYDVKHGVSNRTIAKYISAAAENGLLSDNNKLSDEDQRRQNVIDRLNREMDEAARRRENLKTQQEARFASGDVDGAMALEESINRETVQINGLQQRSGEIQSKMTTHTGYGTLAQAAKRRADMQARMDAVREKAFGKNGQGGYAGEARRYEDAIAKLEESGKKEANIDGRWFNKEQLVAKRDAAIRNLDLMNGKIEDIGKEMRALTDQVGQSEEKLIKEFTGAVDALKDLYGGEEEAAAALAKLTGGRHVMEAGVATRMEGKIRELVKIGEAQGIGAGQTRMILDAMSASSGTAFGVDARDAGISGAGNGHLDMMFSAYGIKAASGARNETERARAIAGAQWGKQRMENTMEYAVLTQARSKLEDGVISQDEYNEIVASLTAGDERTRLKARDSFYNKAYGSVERGRRQAMSPVQMAALMAEISDKGQEDIAQNSNRLRKSDNDMYGRQAEDNIELDRARSDAYKSGMDITKVNDIEGRAEFESTMKSLQGLKGNDDAQFAAASMKDTYERTYREERARGRSEVEAKREAQARAMAQYRRTFESTLGKDVAENIAHAASVDKQNALDAAMEGQAISGDLLKGTDIENIIGLAGGLEENGGVSVGNLGKMADSVFNTLENLRPGDEKLSEAKRKYQELMSAGKYQEAASVLSGDVLQNLSDSEYDFVARRVKEAGLESTAKAKERREKNKESVSYDVETGSEFVRLTTGSAPTEVAVLENARNRNLEAADVIAPTQEQMDEDGKKLREAVRESGAELAAKVMEGKMPPSELFLNPDIPPEQREEALKQLEIGLGAEAFGLISDAVNQYAGGPVDAKTKAQYNLDAAKRSQLGVATRTLASMNDAEFSQYYQDVFGNDDKLEKANKWRHQMMEGGSTKSRTSAMRSLNEHFFDQIQKARENKHAEVVKERDPEKRKKLEEEEARIRANEERFRDDLKGVEVKGPDGKKYTQKLSVDSTMQAELQQSYRNSGGFTFPTGSGKGGGGSSGLESQLMQKMDMLIGSMSNLVDVIRNFHGTR